MASKLDIPADGVALDELLFEDATKGKARVPQAVEITPIAPTKIDELIAELRKAQEEARVCLGKKPVRAVLRQSLFALPCPIESPKGMHGNVTVTMLTQYSIHRFSTSIRKSCP